MNITARRISGSSFSAEDKLEVLFDAQGATGIATHTIELLSGPSINHGGGAPSGEFLHYKSVEEDADADGVIDYSNTVMQVKQGAKGTSIVKAKVKFVTPLQSEEFRLAIEEYENTPNNGSDITAPIASDYETLLESGEITLDWGEDTFV
jgi:hypothetical protein